MGRPASQVNDLGLGSQPTQFGQRTEVDSHRRLHMVSDHPTANPSPAQLDTHPAPHPQAVGPAVIGPGRGNEVVELTVDGHHVGLDPYNPGSTAGGISRRGTVGRQSVLDRNSALVPAGLVEGKAALLTESGHRRPSRVSRGRNGNGRRRPGQCSPTGIRRDQSARRRRSAGRWAPGGPGRQ